LQPEKLSERATRIAQEAKTLEETIEKFGLGFEKTWRDALRQLAVEEVGQVLQKAMDEAEKKSLDIERRRLRPFGEVLICAEQSYLFNGTYYLSAKIEKAGSALNITSRKKGVIYLTVENFNDLVSELKTSILEGKLDEHVHLTAEHLIYDKMTKTSPYTLVRKKKRIG